MSELLPWFFTKEWLWAICSCHSWQKSRMGAICSFSRENHSFALLLTNLSDSLKKPMSESPTLMFSYLGGIWCCSLVWIVKNSFFLPPTWWVCARSYDLCYSCLLMGRFFSFFLLVSVDFAKVVFMFCPAGSTRNVFAFRFMQMNPECSYLHTYCR